MLVDDVVVPLGDYRHSGKPWARLVIMRRWIVAIVIPWMILFTLFWNVSALSRTGASGFPVRVVQLVVGAFFAYVTFAMIVNRTRIALENGILSIRHGPLPWRGNRIIAIDGIERFACHEILGRKRSRSYTVIATLRNGTPLVLLDQLPDAEQARFIEELLTQRAIADRPRRAP